jgi:hypothetical protein
VVARQQGGPSEAEAGPEPAPLVTAN